ncbi:MAG TPA: protein kinase [Gemmataceae bacterium]|nr:protein kinase [Gemmataceae bacterium]
MHATLTAHPDADRLAAFVHGRLATPDRAAVERHVADCADCCRVLMAVPDDALCERLREADTARLGATADVRQAGDIPPELGDHPRYRVVQFLGSGGMGAVYRAEHRRMERPVALKVIHRDLVARPGAVDRFRQEVKAAGRLSHPNIVTAHDADEAGGLHFLVMEFVEGMSLAQLVRDRGRLPPKAASGIVRQAALGLQHAHEQGMVHRDVKPQNLMLTPGGRVKILDFGLARFAREAAPPDDTLPDGPTGPDSLTCTGSVLGTPDFIAPEQARDSSTVDGRADVYSLGCTLYYLLTARVPFPGATAAEMLAAHDRGQPDPLPAGCELPPGLPAVVMKMMARDPADRYPTPVAAAEALAPFARGETGPAADEPVDHRRSWPRWMAMAGGVAILALVAAFVPWNGRSPAGSVDPVLSSPLAPRTVLIVLPGEYEPVNYQPIRDGLERQGGLQIRVASFADEPVRPVAWSPGPEFRPELTVGPNLKIEDFAAVVFPGGHYWEHQKLQPDRFAHIGRFIHGMFAARKCVAGFDEGVSVIAANNLLGGRRATAIDAIRARHPLAAQWDLNGPVVEDGGLVTAGMYCKYIPEFVQAILQVINRQAN